MLDYLSIHAQKAYREIINITEHPDLLFSNDPALLASEYAYNSTYLFGFNRLIRKNRLTTPILAASLNGLMDGIESYLRRYYTAKAFVITVSADPLVPAFKLSVVSYYEERHQLDGLVSLEEVVEWYRANACWDGIKIVSEEKPINGIFCEDTEEAKTEIIYPRHCRVL
ncbi:hypothetical protein [Paenibacillus sp. FJAT-26967]|uniref:hypothetical protein n=1 Tax=Paenibacillus sp. FJAT-26967 TaxID=1729690 RepID=UPI000838A485|nr:hypothetical protein [Paenibacillus sp. FJAT-26967]